MKFHVFGRLKRGEENSISKFFFMIFISGSHVDSIKKIKKKICHIHFKKSGVLGCKEPQSNSQLGSRVTRSTYVTPGISDSPFPFCFMDSSFVGILVPPWFLLKTQDLLTHLLNAAGCEKKEVRTRYVIV